MNKDSCIFCKLADDGSENICENDLFYAKYDANPVSEGHALIIPKKHIVSFFELSAVEVEQFYKLLGEVHVLVDATHKPDGYNVGVNEGTEAGRTVHHLHAHIIPRYKGDVENPVGGIRNVIPEKGDYLNK